MPQVNYTTTLDTALPKVWEFVKDINNWAPFATGYQSHEVVNDRESIWTVKGDVGPISRTTKFHVQITEWVEEERVAFVLKGLNEPITGGGAIRLMDADGGAGTEIRADATIEFGGSIGPVVNHLISPWIRAGADDLVTKIAMALEPEYERPARPALLVRWLRALLALPRLLTSAVLRLVRPSAAPSGTATAPEAPDVSVAATAQPEEAGMASPGESPGTSREGSTQLRIETLLMGPTLDQYSGGGSGPVGIEALAAGARQIEEMGFDGVTTPEAGHDPFLPLMVAAEHTERISLGTNVAIAFPRSPMVAAQIAWDLQGFSGGRFQLGIGTQVKGHNERRYSTPWTGPPGPRLREYLLCLKAIFHTFQTGERPSYEGEHYRFTLMSPLFNPGPIDHPHVPIYIAALNTYMARMAGELCDGVRLHPLGTFQYTKEVILPAVAAGARKTGRDPSEIDLVASPFLVTGRDESEIQAAKAGVKQQIAFYSSTRTYHSVLKFHGWGEVGQTLHQLSLEGKWEEMRDQITDEMLEEFATIGTYDELAPKLKERWGAISTTIHLGLPPGLSKDEALLRAVVQDLKAS